MKKDYNENRSKLAGMIKDKPSTTPIQQVKPVAAKEEKNESHINFWLPTELHDRLKLHAVKSKMSIKQIGIEAFEAYLRENT